MTNEISPLASVAFDVGNAIPDSGVTRLTLDDADTSGGTTTDVWGDNDGTINGATSGVSGANQTYTTNEGFSFDGTDDYVNSGGFDVGQGVSVAAWLRFSSNDNSDVIPVNKRASSGDNLGINIEYGTRASGEIDCFVATDNGSEPTVGSTAVDDGAWHHIVGTFDGSEIELFVDGSSEGTTALSGDQSSSSELAIGKNHSSGDFNNRHYDGDIDDVRVYDKGLSATEASDLYNTGSI